MPNTQTVPTIPTLTQPSIDSVLEKVNAVIDLNKLLRESLENATQALLNVSVATEEQIALVVEWTKEEAQDVTLQGGVVIPNALKLVAELRAQVQAMLDRLPPEYEALKEGLKQNFEAFLAGKEAQAQALKDEALARFDALMQTLEAQKQAQAQDYEAIKQEVQEKLELINTDAFLNEFAELRVTMEINTQKINRILSNHALGILSANASNAVVQQKIFKLLKERRQNATESTGTESDNTESADNAESTSGAESNSATESAGGNNNG